MKKIISRAFASLIIGLTLTAVICAALVFYEMFTIPDGEVVNKILLFGTVNIETIKEDGGFSLIMQIGNPLAFLCVWLVISIFLFLVTITYDQVTKYKKELLAKQNTNNSPGSELADKTVSNSASSSSNTAATNQQTITPDNDNSGQSNPSSPNQQQS